MKHLFIIAYLIGVYSSYTEIMPPKREWRPNVNRKRIIVVYIVAVVSAILWPIFVLDCFVQKGWRR